MTEAEIREYICNKFLGGDREFPLEVATELLDEGICDSLGMVQMAAAFERFLPGLAISDQEVTRENFGSIRAIMAFLERKQN